MPLWLDPLDDRVCLKPKTAEEKSAGGVFLPDTASKEMKDQGTVMWTGPGYTMENGMFRPLTVRPGDDVIYSKYSGNETKLEGTEYVLIPERDILAVIRQEGEAPNKIVVQRAMIEESKPA